MHNQINVKGAVFQFTETCQAIIPFKAINLHVFYIGLISHTLYLNIKKEKHFWQINAIKQIYYVAKYVKNV